VRCERAVAARAKRESSWPWSGRSTLWLPRTALPDAWRCRASGWSPRGVRWCRRSTAMSGELARRAPRLEASGQTSPSGLWFATEMDPRTVLALFDEQIRRHPAAEARSDRVERDDAVVRV